jgi:hypothetical protein
MQSELVEGKPDSNKAGPVVGLLALHQSDFIVRFRTMCQLRCSHAPLGSGQRTITRFINQENVYILVSCRGLVRIAYPPHTYYRQAQMISFAPTPTHRMRTA